MTADVWSHGDAFTVGALIEQRLESAPDREIFDVNGEQWTAHAALRRRRPVRQRDARLRARSG